MRRTTWTEAKGVTAARAMKAIHVTLAVAASIAAATAGAALARLPFAAHSAPRLELSLPKDATPGTASGVAPAQPVVEKAAVRTRSIAEQVNQSQTGSLNAQANDAGSARISGNTTQSQSGSLNKQERKLGVATDGAKAEVAVKDVSQVQRGIVNDQKLHVGTAGQ